MTLELQPEELGLWRDPEAPKHARGAHAVIIGVSSYPHLDKGAEPADSTAGLGQLAVSARTGLKLFQWLNGRGAFGGSPVVSCRLLLSPVAGEEEEVRVGAKGHARGATFDDISAALKAWADDIIASDVGETGNIALFFFSGHGLERGGDQYLLARDVLKPNSAAGRTNALEVDHLWKALRGYGIEQGFMFLDACRNDSAAAKLLGIEGRKVLDTLPDPRSPPKALPCLKATSTGEFAFQSADDGATLFGQALLDSLEGLPPDYIPYDCSVDPWRLGFAALETRVQQQVRELLAARSVNDQQPVEPYGFPYSGKALVALRGGAPRKQQRPTDPPPGEIDPTETIATRLTTAFGHFSAVAPENLAIKGALGDGRAMHDILGHENVTEPWLRTLRIRDVTSGLPLGPDILRVSQARQSESGGVITAWMDVHVPPNPGAAVWMQVGHPGERVCAVVLPGDLAGDVPVRIDVTYERGILGPDWVVKAMTARVGEPEGLEEQVWGPLWAAQRAEQVASLDAAHGLIIEATELERTLQDKSISPLAASAAAVYLLRGGDLEALHDWPRNLAAWFPWLPDGAFLWAETLRLRHDYAGTEPNDQEAADMVAHFVVGCQRGMPRLGRVFDMAARQATALESYARSLNHDLASEFERGAAFVLGAWLPSVSGSHYTAFASTENLSPALVLGTRAAALA